jgi:hypothetical protein
MRHLARHDEEHNQFLRILNGEKGGVKKKAASGGRFFELRDQAWCRYFEHVPRDQMLIRSSLDKMPWAFWCRFDNNLTHGRRQGDSAAALVLIMECFA